MRHYAKLRYMHLRNTFTRPCRQQSYSRLSRLIVEVSRPHTHTHTPLGKTPQSQKPLPDNTQHLQENASPSARFETAIPASERPQTYVLDRVATLIGTYEYTQSSSVRYPCSRTDGITMGRSITGM
jgi:hypothetical protein